MQDKYIPFMDSQILEKKPQPFTPMILKFYKPSVNFLKKVWSNK